MIKAGVKHIILVLVVFGVVSCINDKTQPKENLNGTQLYQKAALFTQENQLDSAIIYLGKAYEKELENPMMLVRDSAFYPLIDNPEFRPKIRNLLKKYSESNHSIMVRNEEPGRRITVTGKILDEANMHPIKDALIELVHTDTSGVYFSEKSMWNPRIFSYLRTNDQGVFSIETIYPGSYPDDDGQEVAPHIHFTIEAEGYRVYASEFVFGDDPLLTINGNSENLPVATEHVEKGKGHYHVTINLQSK